MRKMQQPLFHIVLTNNRTLKSPVLLLIQLETNKQMKKATSAT